MLPRKMFADQEIVVLGLVTAAEANDRKRLAAKFRHVIEGFKKRYFVALPAREYLYILNKHETMYHREQLKATKLKQGTTSVAAKQAAA